MILNGCQQLESLETRCGNHCLDENELLEEVVKHSPKKFHELKIFFNGPVKPELFSEELDPIFQSWANRLPQKSLSITIEGDFMASESRGVKKESMKVIEKFKELGVIKKFKVIDVDEHLYDSPSRYLLTMANGL